MIRVVDGPLYQWESGRKIEIELPEGITINEVHFAKEDEDVALVTKPYEEDGVLLADIPNIHLQTHTKIRVYLFCRDGEEVFDFKTLIDFTALVDRVGVLEKEFVGMKTNTVPALQAEMDEIMEALKNNGII